MRTGFLIAAAGFLALVPTYAMAQNNESRGYGGPLYVGPNFQKGGQWDTPDYGKKSGKKSAPVKREPAKVKKAPVKKEAAPQKETAATDKEKPAESAASTAPSTETAASTGAATCKRFDATSGQTLTVPCQ